MPDSFTTDPDRERIETARDLLEEVSLLTRPEDGSGTDAPPVS
jgi:hypothetical protein